MPKVQTLARLNLGDLIEGCIAHLQGSVRHTPGDVVPIDRECQDTQAPAILYVGADNRDSVVLGVPTRQTSGRITQYPDISRLFRAYNSYVAAPVFLQQMLTTARDNAGCLGFIQCPDAGRRGSVKSPRKQGTENCPTRVRQ